MSKKEIVNIHKRPDRVFEIETFEKPLRTQIADLQQQLIEKDKEIEKVENYYKSREKDIVNDADEIIKKLEKQLAKKDKKIEELKKEKELDNSFWKQECDSLQKTLAEKYKEIDNLKELRKFEIEDKEEIRKNRLQDIIKIEEELAEKDKEIEELKAYKKGAYEKYVAKCSYLQNQIKEIQKQVCEEIREKLKAHCDYTDEENIGWYLTEHKIGMLLDQIEGGE